MTDDDNTTEDARLRGVARAAAGDAAAMTELVRATSPRLWRLCATLVDAATADDLTQETYARAVRSLRSYRGESSPHTWLATIARRVCADEIRRRQRSRALQRRLSRLPSTTTATGGTAATATASATASSDDTGLIELTDAVNRLAPHRREAFLLAAVVGLSYAEVADICRCPIGTVRSRVARARDDLIKALSEDAAAGRARCLPARQEVHCPTLLAAAQ